MIFGDEVSCGDKVKTRLSDTGLPVIVIRDAWISASLVSESTLLPLLNHIAHLLEGMIWVVAEDSGSIFVDFRPMVFRLKLVRDFSSKIKRLSLLLKFGYPKALFLKMTPDLPVSILAPKRLYSVPLVI